MFSVIATRCNRRNSKTANKCRCYWRGESHRKDSFCYQTSILY